MTSEELQPRPDIIQVRGGKTFKENVPPAQNNGDPEYSSSNQSRYFASLSDGIYKQGRLMLKAIKNGKVEEAMGCYDIFDTSLRSLIRDQYLFPDSFRDQISRTLKDADNLVLLINEAATVQIKRAAIEIQQEEPAHESRPV